MLSEKKRYVRFAAELIIYSYAIYLTAVFYVTGDTPGYGGDQVGLFNLFQENSGYQNLSPIDRYFKQIVSQLSQNSAFSVFLCFLIPFLANSLFGISAVTELTKRYPILDVHQPLLKLLLAFEPLTFSLLLSGHVYFLPNLCLYLAIRSTEYPWPKQILLSLLLAIINPYLVIGFVGFIVLLTYDTQKLPKLFLCLVSLVFIIKLSVEITSPLFIANLVWTDAQSRLVASGINPINLMYPDVNSVIGTIFLDSKNRNFAYLNVPESNYSLLLTLLLAVLWHRDLNWRKFLLVSATIVFCLPPTTRILEGFVLPSAILNTALPELRILSRNAAFVQIALLVIIFQSARLMRKRLYGLLSLGLVTLLPLAYPVINFVDVITDRACTISERSTVRFNLQDPWSEYYSTLLQKRVVVFPTLASDKNLNSCHLD